jgi:hypothetical protein
MFMFWVNLNRFLGTYGPLIGSVLNLVVYPCIWYYYGFKLALFVYLAMFANNLERIKK